MKIAVLDYKGKDTGRKVDLSKDVYGIEPNNHSLYLDVKQYLANQRQGTHKAKERADITGSTRKLRSKKVQVQPELVVLNLVFLEVVVEYLGQDLEIIALSLIKI